MSCPTSVRKAMECITLISVNEKMNAEMDWARPMTQMYYAHASVLIVENRCVLITIDKKKEGSKPEGVAGRKK